MPIQSPEPLEPHRAADSVIEHSERKIGSATIMSSKQVALWKALVVAIFLSGVVGTTAFISGFSFGNTRLSENIGEQAGAALVSCGDPGTPWLENYKLYINANGSIAAYDVGHNISNTATGYKLYRCKGQNCTPRHDQTRTIAQLPFTDSTDFYSYKRLQIESYGNCKSKKGGIYTLYVDPDAQQ